MLEPELPTRTIAVEEHFLAQGYLDYVKANGLLVGNPRGGILERLGADLIDLGAARLKDMDANGIDIQVVSNVGPSLSQFPPDAEVRLAEEANDQLSAAISKHPDRFAGFATLPLTNPGEAADELERAVQSLGLKGAMVFGTTEGRFLDHPGFSPVLEKAARLGVPIYIHPNVPPPAVSEAYYSGFNPMTSFALSAFVWGWHSEVAVHVLRLVLSGVFDRLPTLQILIGHLGEMLPYMLDRISDPPIPYARHLPRPVRDYLLKNVSITSSGFFSDPVLGLAVQMFGIERALFSVDYPYSRNEQARRFLDGISLDAQDRERFCHINAEKLLRL